MKDRCAICGTKLSNDLFSFVTRDPVCCICKQKYIGGMATSPGLITKAREKLGLSGGQYLEQDNGLEAARILGRKP